jgi:hypothetical protein
VLEHLGDALHHLAAAQETLPEVHQLRDGLSIADELEQLRGDQRDRFRVIEPKATREPLLREESGLVEEQLVDFLRAQAHPLQLPPSRAAIIAEKICPSIQRRTIRSRQRTRPSCDPHGSNAARAQDCCRSPSLRGDGL